MILPRLVKFIADGASGTEEEITARLDYAAGHVLGSMDLDPQYLEGPDDHLEGNEDFWRGFLDARATFEWHKHFRPGAGQYYESPRMRLKGPPIVLNAFVQFILNRDFQDDLDQTLLLPAEREKLKAYASDGDMWIEGILVQRIVALIYTGRAPALYKNVIMAAEISQWRMPDSPQTRARLMARSIGRGDYKQKTGGKPADLTPLQGSMVGDVWVPDPEPTPAEDPIEEPSAAIRKLVQDKLRAKEGER